MNTFEKDSILKSTNGLSGKKYNFLTDALIEAFGYPSTSKLLGIEEDSEKKDLQKNKSL